ncbi:holo-[acyl-carrier protein] synthase [Clostridium algifaecis]|uniref:Holo-[acyl-carrier-protein] synthase n=1 Tax=Clostridium algifaecis TaxID=1472040 RepID=A0ABS4KTZ8_9CLOT|nr:holo-[acyl-carrier protein] synthase [Clostridium algifaecis]
MILGVGVDIVEIARIKNAVDKHSNFMNKLFNDEEIKYLNSRNCRPEFIAGRFAAKEAVSKALGTGFRGFDFKDIFIDRTTEGKPTAVLRGKAKLLTKDYESYKIHLSISHEISTAVAFAVMEVF